jgi:hypothetical protein
MLMIDLFAGSGGASQEMVNRGWEVFTVDIDPRWNATVVGSITEVTSWPTSLIDLLWASPPCTDFARESMPWCRTGIAPDITLFREVHKLIDQLKPTWWVIENVRGAIPYFGQWQYHAGPIYLWTNLPFLPRVVVRPFKSKLSSRRRAERARTPAEISWAVASAVESLAG